jgi:hypothetical protein
VLDLFDTIAILKHPGARKNIFLNKITKELIAEG